MKDWMDYRAAEVMSAPARTLDEDVSLEEGLRLLTDEEISGAPVVDRRTQRPLGVVTRSDIVAYLAGLERDMSGVGTFYQRSFLRWDTASETWSNLEDVDEDVLKDTTVRDVMTPDVIDVPPDARLPEVVRLLCRNRIHRVLVVEDGELQGIVSSLDVLGALDVAPATTASRE